MCINNEHRLYENYIGGIIDIQLHFLSRFCIFNICIISKIDADFYRTFILASVIELKVYFKIVFTLLRQLRSPIILFNISIIFLSIDLFRKYLLRMIAVLRPLSLNIQVIYTYRLIILGQFNVIEIGAFLVDVMHDY